MMTKFATPQYQDTFRYNWEFEQYNDKSNYWLELDYFINRDNFATRVGLPLDLDVQCERGAKIFRNLGASQLAAIRSRAYKLINESVDISNADEDILKITELYGYAPASAFNVYSFDPIQKFGFEDPRGELTLTGQTNNTSYGIQFDEGLGRFFIFPANSADLAQINTGDTIRINFPVHKTYYEISCPEVEVLRKTSNSFETASFSGAYVGGDGAPAETDIRNYSKWRPWTIHRSCLFSPSNSYITNLRNEVQYFSAKPDIVKRLEPKLGNGVVSDRISSATTPSDTEWINMITNGTEYPAVDSEIEQVYTLWKRTTKYAKSE